MHDWTEHMISAYRATALLDLEARGTHYRVFLLPGHPRMARRLLSLMQSSGESLRFHARLAPGRRRPLPAGVIAGVSASTIVGHLMCSAFAEVSPAEGGKTVLVVDDDQGIREIVADILQDAGYRVLQAADGREALSKLDELNEAPCLVLLDMMMPGMSGAELLDTLRASQQLASLPVVAFSANAHGAPGARRFIRKPVSIDALLRVVHEFCGGP